VKDSQGKLISVMSMDFGFEGLLNSTFSSNSLSNYNVVFHEIGNKVNFEF